MIILKGIFILLFIMIFFSTLRSELHAMSHAHKKNLILLTYNEFKRKMILLLVCIIVILLLIVFADSNITMILTQQEHLVWAKGISYLVDTSPVMVLLIVLYSVSFIKNQHSKFHETLRVSILSFVAVLIVGGILKVLIARTRPFVDINPYEFFQYTHFLSHHINKYLSMPSEHTLRVAALLLPFIFSYKRILIRFVLWFIIVLVMYCRVVTLNHWTSDVVAALILALAISHFIYKNAEIYRRK
ncbi:MAG: phosphatase PAP2 family protein [Fusobacteria bacterium]|nr:phosphatase PAP2 family protein [Fusobacteriota bacterium]